MFRQLLGHDRKLRSLRRGRNRAQRPSAARFQPRLEALEQRLAPATYVWAGVPLHMSSHLWSDPLNWAVIDSPDRPPTTPTGTLTPS